MQKAQGDQSHPAGTEREQESAKSQGCLFTRSPTPTPKSESEIYSRHKVCSIVFIANAGSHRLCRGDSGMMCSSSERDATLT